MINPAAIWGWYSARPKWQKVLLFVFIVLLIVLSVLPWLLIGKRDGGGDDPVSVAKDGLETAADRSLQAAASRDEKYAEFIAEEKAKRDALEAENAKEVEINEGVHIEIDNADDIAAVDRALSRGRSERD